MWNNRKTEARRGAAAVMAMMFLVLITTLSLAMYSTATLNVQSATNLSDVDRARAIAESGLRWQAWRFIHMDRPTTPIGVITSDVADDMWDEIKDSIIADYATLLTVAERPMTETTTTLTSSLIAQDSGNLERFRITIEQDATDHRILHVTSTGTYRGATRSVSMDFNIDKKIKYAVVGKVPIQLGRNTIVEGPVAMSTANKYPPILMLSDFMHFDDDLQDQIEDFNEFLQDEHAGYDNRVSVNNTAEYAAAQAAGYSDYNGDAYIDEYDLFVQQYDDNGDKAVSEAEFTNPLTSELYDANLFAAIDAIGAPMSDGETPRTGYNDGIIDNRDGYAKVRGQLILAPTAAGFESWIATNAPSKTINDYIQGTVIPTEAQAQPVKFGATVEDIFDVDPANFEACANGFRDRSGTNAGTANVVAGSLIENTTLTSANANAGTVTEKTPYGSTAHQATYKRPKFSNMTFRNVKIPKGLNALFDNCTFEGVTWVDGERDITTSGGSVTYDKNEGMNWSKRKSSSGYADFTADKVLIGSGTPTTGQTRTHGSTKGNNLRFNNCNFNGPIAGNYATAYTHFANSWEFTGETMFDNQADDTATIVSPQVNIEMGSFTNPGEAPSTLIGVVVAGNLDIRGTSNVDGSIIITGDGAGNTTLAYFGASDASTDPDAPMPEGGWGRLNIRYNPTRALPDGIDIAIDILPDVESYEEGT